MGNCRTQCVSCIWFMASEQTISKRTNDCAARHEIINIVVDETNEHNSNETDDASNDDAQATRSSNTAAETIAGSAADSKERTADTEAAKRKSTT
jgi:hypothetical protein